MRGSILAFLMASQALFLWMFLAADPLEQIAAAPGLLTTPAQEAAMRFAAAWRHGMAGNSPLYLPGFFLTAAAVWVHAASHGSPARYAIEIVSAAGVALVLASLVAPWGADRVLQGFSMQHPLKLPDGLEPARAQAAAIGGYTLFTWTVFVACARTALVRRRWYPFLAPAALTVVLALVRPWTADDFTRFWAAQMLEGDGVAWMSFVAAIAVSTALVRSERCPRELSQPEPRAERSHKRGTPSAPANNDEQHVSGEHDRIKAG